MVTTGAGGWDELRFAVLAAGTQVVDLLARPEVAEGWAQPSALADMTVGGLATHVSQMISAGVGWLGAPPDTQAGLAEASLDEIYGLARVDAEAGIDGAVAAKIRGWAEEGAGDGAAAIATRAAGDLALSVGLPPPTPDPRAAAAAICELVALCRGRVGDLVVIRALSRPERSDPDDLRAL